MKGGEPMEGRGRNGYFQVRQIYAWMEANKKQVHINLWSRSSGNAAPIIISGTPEEITGFCENILIDGLGVSKEIVDQILTAHKLGRKEVS
jgi:hypothetical protein